MTSLYDHFERVALQHGDKTAIIFGAERYSYSEVLILANRWYETILAAGVQNQRPRVAVLSENPAHNAAISIGIAKVGGACIPTNFQLLPEQLLENWHAAGVSHVVYDPAFQIKINSCADQNTRFISTGDAQGALADYGVRHFHDQQLISDQAEVDFLVTLSSGSTGVPKPIVVSQDVKLRRAKQAWDLYGLSSDDVVLCASPFFHSLGQRLTFVPLLLGATMVYLRQFTPKAWLQSVSEHRVSFVVSVSSHLYALKEHLLDDVSQLQSLKTMVTSSAPIDPKFKQQIFDATGCNFHEIYGATEIACATNLSPEQAVEKCETVGSPCPGVEIQILDKRGTKVPTGEVGEIAVKSPLVFEGYFRRPELTMRSFVDGYFLTGDLGKLDREGFLSYVGRKKDVIISGGMNIYPGDIERVILQHSAVREAAVIGVENDLLGEVIVAVCTVKSDANIERDLRRYANKKLAPYQRPLKYFYVDVMPLTPSGKVSKMMLRQQFGTNDEDWTASLRAMLFSS